MTNFVFGSLPLHHMGGILVDPPWAFKNYSGPDSTPHRTEEDHYEVINFDELTRFPVKSLAARDCALFMWVIDTHLDQAIELGKAWGFAYKTRAFEWLKETKDGSRLKMGMGKWTRKEMESVLLFTLGSPRRLNADVRQSIWQPAREHSRKPDDTYGRIERLVGGPYCELFATQRWPGWYGWGKDYPMSLTEALSANLAARRALHA